MDLLDPMLVRRVKAAASRLEVRGVDREDLAQEAFLRFVKMGVPSEMSHAVRVATLTMQTARTRQLYAGRGKRVIRRHAPLNGDSIPDQNYPEPLPETIFMLQGLTDIQSAVVTLTCGLDGVSGRSFREVARLLGCTRQYAWETYHRAIRKLAAQ